ncbi:hypothetical protein CspeluHIS016_0205430 [Cutaneotrichosporon spelunceum]|uniref:non-specific serine/threonine protein kinase n=1 Tax=Cutaneotrichosporon spelunceum TaxID=1672016 RepID=A0AAD3TRG2_9TREE|nr:hypothetical protein CspeluHIS016_0205430 [Cutaneotrichosporon spelunceum]
MTQPPRANEDQTDVQDDLLDQVLREGLASGGGGDPPAEIQRSHKLLSVLFNQCVLRPPEQVDQTALERTHLTLSILARQSSQNPELLVSQWDGRPFYTFLLTRLVIAAAQTERADTPRHELVAAFVAAAVRVLRTMVTDVSDHGETYMRGPSRVTHALRDMVHYVRDSFELKETSMLGHDDMPADRGGAAQLIVLNIVLQTPAPFASGVQLAAARVLSDLASRFSHLPPERQARFAAVVTTAIPLAPLRHALARAAVAVVQWPEIDDDPWQKTVEELLKKVETEGDASLHRDVWQGLLPSLSLPDGSLIQLDSRVGRAKVMLLLQPAAPHLSFALIHKTLPKSCLERWAQDVTSAHAELVERLARYMVLPPPTSRKRKHAQSPVEERALTFLRSKVPELKIESVDSLRHSLAALEPSIVLKLLGTTPMIACALCQCSDVHHKLPYNFVCKLVQDGSQLPDEHARMRALGVVLNHTATGHVSLPEWDVALARAWKAFSSSDRRTRIAAGNFLSATYLTLLSSTDPDTQSQAKRELLNRISQLLGKPRYAILETAILLLGDLGRNVGDEHLYGILELLLQQFGSPSQPIRAIVYTQLVDVATHRGKQPYTLLAPYLDHVGVLLAECLVPHPTVVAETMQLIGYNRQPFFSHHLVRKAVVPALVLGQNRPALDILATILGKALGLILIDDAADVLAKVFLTPSKTNASISFLAKVLRESTHDPNDSTTIGRYIQAYRVNLIAGLVTELGDEDATKREAAKDALRVVQRKDILSPSDPGDLGSYLKPHMVGALAEMTEQLVLIRSRADIRRKIVRSLGELISLVGDSMASFSPQIIASLQSTLCQSELRLQALQTWYRFVDLMKYVDVGPYIGATVAAFVAEWPNFTFEERHVAVSIVKLIDGNHRHLQAFKDDIVLFDHIDELKPFHNNLLSYRNKWSTKKYLRKLLERTSSKNIAIATASVRELRWLLETQGAEVMKLARGDTFDPIMGKLVQSLLSTSSTDGDSQELRDLSYECFGILGALDPDRFVTRSDEPSMTIMSNFTDHEESVQFAIHLIRDLLTTAFRATNDTKHQKTLSFAIQELLKFCDFGIGLVNVGSRVPLQVRQRWDSLEKDVLETVTPFLDTQFVLNKDKKSSFEYPIYPTTQTYREWIQAWTVDLIGRVMDFRSGDRNDAQTIFGAFNTEAHSQDVAVANHILPHLVLHVLLSGSESIRSKIGREIDTVLTDIVGSSKESLGDKRTSSAHVIFNLMDHLSKWLRLARADKRRSSHVLPVEKLLAGIDTELAANAALKARAYARSLRNFEERIIYLRQRNKQSDSDLQPYFESLHEIYAELDEPDGMEGVSTAVVSPTLELQIREHESTGRWASAQSCWELRLQPSPDDLSLNLGLLKCLKNLGHFDTLRTHIRGVLTRHPEWSSELAQFQAEGAWMIGDWETVRSISNSPPIAKVFMAIQSGGNVPESLKLARRDIGSSIAAGDYSRSYDSILQLHLLREVEMIHSADLELSRPVQFANTQNANAINQRRVDGLIASLAERFETTLPSFHAREEILSRRRVAFSLVKVPQLHPELGQSWIQSAKIARKSGYDHTAYSAALRAREAEAPFAFIEQAKLTRAHGGILKALRELEQPIAKLIRESERADVIDLTGNNHHRPRTDEDLRRDRSLAKATLLEARWSQEGGRSDKNDILLRFRKATELGSTLESPFFHLGRYYDMLAASEKDLAHISSFNNFTCVNYFEALQRGVKYIYQTMPRLLTVWLDLAENKEMKKNSMVQRNVETITNLMARSKDVIMPFQFLTAFPQMISRITHPNQRVRDTLVKILSRVVRAHSQQTLWQIVGSLLSKRKDRIELMESILNLASGPQDQHVLRRRIKDAGRMGRLLLQFSNDKPESTRVAERSVANNYPYLRDAFPSTMILPLQDALTVVLPSAGSSALRTHNAFPDEPVTIEGVEDKVDIMPSLQQPKKLVFKGSDGKRYPFLCKPHDDLRKDARLMDMNSMLNKFLKSTSESRRRHLYIRTYAVMPLNEECGLIEWVAHTHALKPTLEKLYDRHKKKVYTREIYNKLDAARKSEDKATALKKAFLQIAEQYKPTVFHEWFMLNWPEPSAWLSARTNYARTLAVMSMIGFVLGLGDRHGENILFDGLTGDTVQVDLNCLFDRAKAFEVPERVPFRLTQNMEDALGVTGVEGVFRKAAEITMGILRSNSDSMMSVLEAFIHDPLIEWTKSRHKSSTEVRAAADRNLAPIQRKLRGVVGETEQTVPNQVDALIKEATSIQNLSLMYVGWAAWL